MLKKKKCTQSKNSNKKLTLWFLYEMVFVWNDSSACVCKFRYHFVQKNPFSKLLLCFCKKWSPLHEVVFVRNGLCTKWLDTEDDVESDIDIEMIDGQDERESESE